MTTMQLSGIILVFLSVSVLGANGGFFSDLYSVFASDPPAHLTNTDYVRARAQEIWRSLKNVLMTEDVVKNITAGYREDLYEGDIALPDSLMFPALFSSTANPGNWQQPQRNGLRDRTYVWPNARVPYEISSAFNNERRATIASALREISAKTCVRFEGKLGSDTDFVSIILGVGSQAGCWSWPGKQGGRQEVSIGEGCQEKGIIIHELLHALGFLHEQSRSDRDKYVDVLWQNIDTQYRRQFNSYDTAILDDQGLPYDFNSVMHYNSHAFSSNNMPTIRSKQQYNFDDSKLGQRVGMSLIDAQEVNKMYNCPGSRGTTTPLATTTTTTTTATTKSKTTSVPQKLTTTITPTTATTTISDTGTTNCQDIRKLEECRYFKKIGYCRYHKWTKKNCQKTCNKCPKLSGQCKDTRQDCGGLKHFCRVYPHWMKSNCRNTCKHC